MTVTDPPPNPLSDQLAHLTPDQKRALLLQLLREREAAASAHPTSARPTRPSQNAPLPAASFAALPAASPDPAHAFDPFPLTDIQHAYWLGRTDGLELGGVGAHVY
ncbi:MAG: amino acid adenylation protein, partial [Deinococcus sp.]|nr:amino acid adenylation protein [Deinococcus sp.]